MSISENGINRVLLILKEIKNLLSFFDHFEDIAPPPEPSTAYSRAKWASLEIKLLYIYRDEMLGLSHALPSKGEGDLFNQIFFVKNHVDFVVSQYNDDYILVWLKDRGISLNEMGKPRLEMGNISWLDLLGLHALSPDKNEPRGG